MRKQNLLLILFLASFCCMYAQRVDTLPGSNTSQQEYLKYMSRRSTYKTVGWVLLGTGAALFGTAYLINVKNGWNGENKAEDMFAAGLVVAALSPAFFIMAGIYKRKARLVLKPEQLTSVIMFSQPYYPAVSLRLDF